jgi:hypothetical protein
MHNPAILAAMLRDVSLLTAFILFGMADVALVTKGELPTRWAEIPNLAG